MCLIIQQMKNPVPAEAAPVDARERILAAAERLFAAKGVEKTSTREITAEASVNVASVNYYFRSKEALAEELFVRLAARSTSMRLAELADHPAHAPRRIADLVECFIRPYFEPLQTGQLLARFILQHRLAPNDMTRRVYEQYLDPFALKFIDALCRVDVRVPRAQWVWRYTLMTSTVVLAVTDSMSGNRVAALSGGAADAMRGDELKRNLAAFLNAALTVVDGSS
jgi:AcrR family transcriptional regulator